MNSPRWIVVCALVFSSLSWSAQAAPKAAPAVNPDAAATLVVFNEDDRDSVELARFYAEKRGIPKAQVVGLKCPRTEEITRAEYDATIAEPLRRIFNAKGWWKLRAPDSALGPVESNKIRFVALIRGIPLKIAPVVGYEGDKVQGDTPISPRNEAAVDSEVAVLGFRTRIISGAMNNPYFRSYTPIAEANRPELMLVCRLDGPTAEIVRGMITDGLATEAEGLTGFAYVDARGITEAGYTDGDNWLFALANDARRRGTPVVLDNGSELFPENYPMTKAALYFGWYSEHASGPFVRPEFRFSRGAIAVHIHSFSAATVRNPLQQWVGPLLAAGAAATVGNVYEPYLALTVQLDVFHDRLRSGLTFAESCYMAERALSWMNTCIGDPLYRPFKTVGQLDERPTTGEWADYRQAARQWFTTDRATGDEALRVAARKDRSGMILEGLGLLQLSVNDRDAALVSFDGALGLYGKSEDAVRVAIHELMQLRAAGRADDVRAVLKRAIALSPRPDLVELLRAIALPRPVNASPAPPVAAALMPVAPPAKR